ncbi:AAA domain-containing protein [Microbulbifer sp. OS29]|uniref:AAA domain-containing protein n=1 Tax=Microbulbifer okhotskensis TaxID=2926617 RepID=A0A9X2EPG6_9GAMM|nr:AAA domain-containing protein [Microbulbifer okhotskensis]MCO1333318.1 AAA domain-containing protein [Microbulbifer okhotskensis]
MQHPPNQLIEYFRRCYQADSYDLSLNNILNLKVSRRLFSEEQDYLGAGQLPRIPLAGAAGAKLLEQADSHRKERRLIYGCLFICGSYAHQGSLAAKRKLCAPLIYFPANVYYEEEHYVEINHADARVNLPVLRQLLKSDVESSTTDGFPAPSSAITSAELGAIGRWLGQFTILENIEELGRWPKLEAQAVVEQSVKSSGLSLVSASAVVLADRSRGARGVLHELQLLTQEVNLSAPLRQLLGGRTDTVWESVSEPEMLPGLLSAVQERALKNAARYPLSLVSGPPGTGKSFTIAAMVIDRILHGESVLVVSKTSQALEVVRDKLRVDYGLTQGCLHAEERGFAQSLKARLNSLLKEGVEVRAETPSQAKRAVKRAYIQLQRLEVRFSRALRLARFVGAGRLAQWIVHYGAALLGSRLNVRSLWDFQEQIDSCRRRFEKLAALYLNTYRQEKLRILLEEERGTLASFLQALRSRSSKVQAERFAQTDMRVVLQAFPIWLVEADELNEVMPLLPTLFDVVIFDEATQCDVSSALPALFRAQRAVIVGDGKQLRHVSFLSGKRQLGIWQGVMGEPDLPAGLSYREQSLLDLASDVIPTQKAVVMLDEHYRSAPELIAFSNHAFYADRLKIMQARPVPLSESALEFHPLCGRRGKNGRNRAEKDWVIKQLGRHFDRYASALIKPSVGVLSPYRDQVEYLEVEITKAFALKQLQVFSVRVATPYGFQGEERDLMLISLVVDSQSLRAASYLNRADMFNVAITRAKERQLVALSIDPEALAPDHLLRRYVNYTHLAPSLRGGEAFVCSFSREVSRVLSDEGIPHWIGFPVAGQRVDVVCEVRGRFLGVDLIGFPGDYESHYSNRVYKALYRAGIPVLPLPYINWLRDREACVAQLLAALHGEGGR